MTAKKLVTQLKSNDTITTGRLSKLLGVAPRTANKYCDIGWIPCYRIPGSQDRRVKVIDVVKFIRESGLPMPMELEPKLLIAFATRCDDKVPNIVTMDCPIEFGIMIGRGNVRLAVVSDALGVGLAITACKIAIKYNPTAKIVLLLDQSTVVASDALPLDVVVVRHPVSWDNVVFGLAPTQKG